MEIVINGINAETIIGCYEHERDFSQKLIFNLKIEIDNTSEIGKTDALKETINYDEIIIFIQDLVQKTDYQLLEKLAIYLNDMILERYLIASSVVIEVIKPAICGVLAREIKVIHKTIREYSVALAFGSNTENLPKQQIISAIEILSQYIKDIKISKLYKTKPYAYLEQNNFYNAVIIGQTNLKPDSLLAKIKKLEKMLGKTEICQNGPRIIDIDIIFFNNWIYQNHFLIIPHPNMHLRDFVLKPLMDVAGSWVHPVLNKSIDTLYNELPTAELTIIGVEDYVSNIN